jgi:hypothetical protein
MRRCWLLSLVLLLGVTLGHAGGVFWSDRGTSQLKRMNFDGSGLQTITLFQSIPLGDGMEEVTVRALSPLPENSEYYLRLTVVLGP